MIIEKVENEQASLYSAGAITPIQYAYFYCKHGNPKKDNLLAITGALIAQLARQNPDISPLLYETIIRIGDTHLTSRNDAEKLLRAVLTGSSASHTYIIVDGLDECASPEDITKVITTLTRIAEDLNATSPGAYRLFFTSTDENVVRQQLRKAVKLKIRPQDNKQDIKHYTTVWCSKIQNKFQLSNEERQEIESNVMSKAQGKYICTSNIQVLRG